MVEKHLGSHGYKTWTDEGVLKFLHKKFDVKSMVDVGCGPGGMEELAVKIGIDWTGIEGDESVKKENTILHDFTKGKIENISSFDLAWSVEFLEHVEEKYMNNYMHVFCKCKYIICTAAPPGWGGTHHVNEQNSEYWIQKFSEHGFSYDEEVTKMARIKSTMKIKNGKNKLSEIDPSIFPISFMKLSGMFFRSNFNGT